MTKTKLIQLLADRCNLSKAQVTVLLDTLVDVTTESLKTDGLFVIPDIVRLTLKDMPARPERPGVNAFTKEPITIAAKPAFRKVRVTPTTSLKKAFA